ncbi:YccS family putative transporter [Larsenimonas rhizosphaerae]|uniref:YccS family putative transporter n=1 Tax=Larsenimonas rhizosphaerae TaxID=2944682 RepID=A0AA41ZGE0_9GAMM|nr:YccS family putative transporter [Larsenimonas rhizosphaerae]MCM2129619.1 YccS family putative transporter [Larsenimonas rhizosphaerae]MCX2524277.1 YccS family putative transporter [Larsenimonas rhizosphaerae]
MSSLLLSLQRLWSLKRFSSGLKVFIALSGAMGLGWYLGHVSWVIPWFLGIIACALAETDDNVWGRTRAVALTLAAFWSVALGVQMLLPHPIGFVAALTVGAFLLTMGGALGERYGTIARATLILAVYTMIGLEQSQGNHHVWWFESTMLTLGAAWYGALSILWCVLFSRQPVQQGMAELYRQLSEYLILKSSLFEPSDTRDIDQTRLALAQQNTRVVMAMNQVKELIINRLDSRREQPELQRYLTIYFIAQSLHERASSTHYPYHTLAETFFHSDILFRCQRLLKSQGKACRSLGRAIRRREPLNDTRHPGAMEDLHTSLAWLHQQEGRFDPMLLGALDALAHNLSVLDQELARAHAPEETVLAPHNTLYDRSPKSLRDAWARFRQHMKPSSPIFRHALRLTLALVAGVGVMQVSDLELGFWILLTTLFVCQPNFGSTRLRLTQRIAGTIVGLVAGWASLTLFPSPWIQSTIAVAAGVAFFVNRSSRYMLATGAITLMVVCCFNQVLDGYSVIWPRLVDTVIGSLLSGLAVFLVLPDWQGRRIHQLAATALKSNGAYLRQLIVQYSSGKQDDLDYRLARRNAHNADMALSSALSNMALEPGHFRKDAEACLPLMVTTHTLLNYLSALGAHRDALPAHPHLALLDESSAYLAQSLEEVADDLTARRAVPGQGEEGARIEAALKASLQGMDSPYRLVQMELLLISQLLSTVREQAARLQSDVSGAHIRSATA